MLRLTGLIGMAAAILSVTGGTSQHAYPCQAH
jgi:hypothetical protein